MAVEWQVPYRSIDRYTSLYVPGGEGSSARRRVTLHIAGDRLAFWFGKDDGEALMRTLRRRAPESGEERWWQRSSIGSAVGRVVIAAVLVIVAIGFVKAHLNGSSATSSAAPNVARQVFVGECLDGVGQRTGCRSADAVYQIARCSVINRDLTKAATGAGPEIGALARRVLAEGVCLDIQPLSSRSP